MSDVICPSLRSTAALAPETPHGAANVQAVPLPSGDA